MIHWLRYLARRLLSAVLLVVVVSTLALTLVRMAPGDATMELVGTGMGAEAIARERERLGLDRPFASQYVEWLRRAVRLDFGVSLRYGRPVRELVAERARNTAVLALSALAAATMIGLPLGIFTGARRHGVLPAIVRGGSFLALSLPPLVTSLLLVLVAARTGWLPVGGMSTPGGSPAGVAALLDVVRHLLIPAAALALPVAAALERLQSGAVAFALGEPWVNAVLARGVSPTRVLWHHVVRVAIKPVASVYGILIGSLLSGSFIVELITSWPGLGRLTYDALLARDLYLVAGCAAAGAVFLAAGTLASDLALVASDPRLREER